LNFRLCHFTAVIVAVVSVIVHVYDLVLQSVTIVSAPDLLDLIYVKKTCSVYITG